MFCDLIARFRAMVKETAAALRKKLEAAVHTIRPTPPAVTCARAAIVVSENSFLSPGMRLRYRRTSSHAPVVSLFTFFRCR